MGNKIFRSFLLISTISLISLFSACTSKQPSLFEVLPASATGIDFINKPREDSMFNILYYLYYYNGGGVATGDINNDGLPDIYFTSNNIAGNKLYLNKGDFKFEDVTTQAGVAGKSDWASGVTMADINADGFLDIYVTASSQHHGLKGSNELYINNKNGTFTESAEQYGLNFSGFGTQAAFFDFDRDGDLDCYLLNHSQKPNSNIVDTSNRRKYSPVAGDRLYRNDLATIGKFTDVSAAAGIFQSSLGYGLGIAIADLNHDGWDDIYIGNDFHENDYYYVNNGNGTFTESSSRHFRHYSRFSMGNDINDYNNDGQPDIVTVDMLPPDEKVLKTYGSDENPDTYKFKLQNHGYQHQYSKNSLQRNNGEGISFSEMALQSGVGATDWSWAPLFADFDNDGNKDLFISSGIVKRPVDMDYVRFVSDLVMKMDIKETAKFDQQAIDRMPDGASHPFFFKGDGKLKFTDVSSSWGTEKISGYFNGAAYADLNNDGNLDMVVNALHSKALILKNTTPPKFTVEINFNGNAPNTFGLGTKVWLFTNGKMQYQQLSLTRGFQSSVEPILHFGTDSLRYIDSILVVWPDQKFQILKNVPAKGDLQVKQLEAGGQFDYNRFFKPKPELLQNITDQIGLGWMHQENAFFDQNKQYLIPHQLSTLGPKLTVGDLNSDGLEDIYVCGAAGQRGFLLLQNRPGTFVMGDTTVFSAAINSEETDALFFDANNDTHPDLYVTSGGNELDNDHPALADNLYINDGKGKFSLAKNDIPAILRNKSCVRSSDVDKDGDIDLFVGGLADAKRYGIPQSSYLLLNDGKGKFSVAASEVIRLDSAGLVTSAAFSDLNKDGWEDLVVSGEWMPIRIYMNQKGIFKPVEIANSTGLWQSLFVADVNGDGSDDILAGNWGHNNKLFAGKSGPVKLYVKDFDKNGSLEQIMTYNINGQEYTFLAKDELERALPVLKKAYLQYSDVAGKTVQYMFDDLFNNFIELKAEVLGSACFFNDGSGNFKMKKLPEELQLAPIFSYTSVPGEPNVFVAFGNFYGTIPYEGRYDALQPTFFSYDSATDSIISKEIIPSVSGEFRDAKWIKTASGKDLLVAARNNDGLIFFKKQ